MSRIFFVKYFLKSGMCCYYLYVIDWEVNSYLVYFEIRNFLIRMTKIIWYILKITEKSEWNFKQSQNTYNNMIVKHSLPTF